MSQSFFSIISLISILLFSACNQQSSKSSSSNHKPDSAAIEKNDAAVKIFQNYLLLKKPVSVFHQAIDSVNQAIKTDSNYALAYYNKARMFAEVDSIFAAIKVLDSLIKQDSSQIKAITQQGFLYEKMGKQTIAQEKYEKAITEYEKKLQKNPDDVKMQSERAFLFIFTHSKQKALSEINKVLKNYPNNETAKAYKNNIKTFDREQFISTM